VELVTGGEEGTEVSPVGVIMTSLVMYEVFITVLVTKIVGPGTVTVIVTGEGQGVGLIMGAWGVGGVVSTEQNTSPLVA
jgi:hypothetical protein